MNKVLFVTRYFRGELFGDIDGFRERNWEIRVLTSSSGYSQWNIPARIKAKMKCDVSKNIERERIVFENKVLKTAEEFNPDIIYVCHGTQLSPKVIDEMRKKYYMFLELTDRLCFWPETYNTCTHYHLCVTYSKEDSEYILMNMKEEKIGREQYANVLPFINGKAIVQESADNWILINEEGVDQRLKQDANKLNIL